MITKSEAKTIFEPAPYGESSQTHPAIRFLLKLLTYACNESLVTTIILMVMLYVILLGWLGWRLWGSHDLYGPLSPFLIAITCSALITYVVPIVSMSVLQSLGGWVARVHSDCRAGAVRPLLLETVRIEQIEQLVPVDLERGWPGYLVRTRDDEFFFFRIQQSGDWMAEHQEAFTRSELPEILEVDLNQTSGDLLAVRGLGQMVAADDRVQIDPNDLPFEDYRDFCVFPKDRLSREILGLFHVE